jgi:hypothetical protein
LTTITWRIDGAVFKASSTLTFKGTTLPPRWPSSAVTTIFAPQSLMRSDNDFGENPPNTTEWTAPMRAHASIATAASMIMGI